MSAIRLRLTLFAAALLACLVVGQPLAHQPPAGPLAEVIVQAASADAAAEAVARAGGAVDRRLAIIDAVSAAVAPGALARLRADGAVRVYGNGRVRAADRIEVASPRRAETGTDGYTLYPSAATGASALHATEIPTQAGTCTNQQFTPSDASQSMPLQGWGVTVAVIDSGVIRMRNRVGSNKSWDSYDPATGALYAEGDRTRGLLRCMVYRDFLPRSPQNDNQGSQPADPGSNSTDQNGHGTHVISTIADGRLGELGRKQRGPVGVAPKVNLVIARALDKDGVGTYDDMIAAIEWVVENRARYNIRVLNLSIYALVAGPYWSDPLNQAVMRAWQAGLVVVAAAGNSGPAAGTITAPGNVPYVITVGAVRSGRYNLSGEDELADYSSRGPTESAFVKPDVLVPASRTIAPVPDTSTLALAIPEARIFDKADVDFAVGRSDRNHTYYQLSGTSMAAAQVSGLVALMLQANPSLTNDQVKFRLLATARPAIDQATGEPAYSVWEQGAGLADTRQAVLCDASADTACAPTPANQGMDLVADLTSETHYWGYSVWVEPPGEFRLLDEQGEPVSVWSGGGRIWAGGGRIWAGNWVEGWVTGSSLWAGGGRIWAGATPVTDTTGASSEGELLFSDQADPPLFQVSLPAVLR